MFSPEPIDEKGFYSTKVGLWFYVRTLGFLKVTLGYESLKEQDELLGLKVMERFYEKYYLGGGGGKGCR